MNNPRCPALYFVYILMPGKEEWALVQLGSQHNCVELPVRPVFPDYLSVSYDYDVTNLLKMHLSILGKECLLTLHKK